MSASNLKIYTPKVRLTFSGAMSGKRYILPAWVPVELDPAEVPHLDPRDIQPGVHQRPLPEPVIKNP